MDFLCFSGVFSVTLVGIDTICKNTGNTCMFHCINSCRIPQEMFELTTLCSNSFLGTQQMVNHEKKCVIPNKVNLVILIKIQYKSFIFEESIYCESVDTCIECEEDIPSAYGCNISVSRIKAWSACNLRSLSARQRKANQIAF